MARLDCWEGESLWRPCAHHVHECATGKVTKSKRPVSQAPLPRMTEARNEAFGSPCWGSNPSHPADWRSALPVELHGQRHICLTWGVLSTLRPLLALLATLQAFGLRASFDLTNPFAIWFGRIERRQRLRKPWRRTVWVTRGNLLAWWRRGWWCCYSKP